MTAPARGSSQGSITISLLGCRVLVPGAEPGEPALPIDLRPGGCTVLVGRSGEGKSLLCRLALGCLPGPPLRVAGSLRIRGESSSPQDVDLAGRTPGSDLACAARLRGTVVGYVPQGGREALVPGWSVARFLATLGPARPQDRELTPWLPRLGLPRLEAIATAAPTELSEGMIRRLLLAIALAGTAPLLVVDEPTTGLDPRLRTAIGEALASELARGRGLLLATHDVPLARRVGSRFLLVQDGRAVAGAEGTDPWPEPFAPWEAGEDV